MFFSKLMFTKRGSLAKIWLAAHQQKMTKSTVVMANIEESVHDIVDPTAPLALRLSGQLLLGVVRIYQRKAKYLQEDCSDALTKIKMSFAGAVDLPTSTAAGANAITLTSTGCIDDFMVPDIPLSQMAAMVDDGAFDDTQIRANESDIMLEDTRDAGIDVDNVFDFNTQLEYDAENRIDDRDELLGTDEAEITLQPLDDNSFGEYQSDLPDIEVAREALVDAPMLDMGIPSTPMNLMADEAQQQLELKQNLLDIEPVMDDERVDLSVGAIGDDITLLNANTVAEAASVDLDASALIQQHIAVRKERSIMKVMSDKKTQISQKQFKRICRDTSAIVCVRQRVNMSKRRRLGDPSTQFGLLDLPPNLHHMLQYHIERGNALTASSTHERNDVAEDALRHHDTDADIVPIPIADDLAAYDDTILGNNDSAFMDDYAADASVVMSEAPLDDVEAMSVGEVRVEQQSGIRSPSLQSDRQTADSNKGEVDRKEEANKSGWSERTRKMYHLLARHLDSAPEVIVQQLVEGKSRSIAAGVFLECLVLKSHGFMQLNQDHAYAPLRVSSGPRFKESLPTVIVPS